MDLLINYFWSSEKLLFVDQFQFQGSHFFIAFKFVAKQSKKLGQRSLERR